MITSTTNYSPSTTPSEILLSLSKNGPSSKVQNKSRQAVQRNSNNEDQLALAIRNLSNLNPLHGNPGHGCPMKDIAMRANELLKLYQVGPAQFKQGPEFNQIEGIEYFASLPCAPSKLYLDLALLYTVGLGCNRDLQKAHNYLHNFKTSRCDHQTVDLNTRPIVERIYSELNLNTDRVSTTIKSLCVILLGKNNNTVRFMLEMDAMRSGSR
ncbi:MAG: hypothetical protein S4CHLAM20_02220 [Chlamydiia bacterium]|nr:hypothetical protein [Chlamydiia bacterium]